MDFKTINALPLFVKIMWIVLAIQFFFWVIPFTKCVIAGLGTDTCWTILSVRTALLFIISLPITYYITQMEYKKITGKNLPSIVSMNSTNRSPNETQEPIAFKNNVPRNNVQRNNVPRNNNRQLPISRFDEAKTN